MNSRKLLEAVDKVRKNRSISVVAEINMPTIENWIAGREDGEVPYGPDEDEDGPQTPKMTSVQRHMMDTLLALQEIAHTFGWKVQVEMVDAFGQQNGWPVVRFTGPVKEVKTMLMNVVCCNNQRAFEARGFDQL